MRRPLAADNSNTRVSWGFPRFQKISQFAVGQAARISILAGMTEPLVLLSVSRMPDFPMCEKD